jgi:exonuclease III
VGGVRVGVGKHAPHIYAHFVTSHNEQKTKAIKCGAFNYNIVVNAHRVTSMADTYINAVRKQKKAEYDKQYRLKCKLLLQQQASKYIYMIRYFHP